MNVKYLLFFLLMGGMISCQSSDEYSEETQEPEKEQEEENTCQAWQDFVLYLRLDITWLNLFKCDGLCSPSFFINVFIPPSCKHLPERTHSMYPQSSHE